jgi:cytochrome c6
MRLGLAAVVSVVLLVSPLASGATATTILVTIRDTSFKLSATAAPLGTVAFSVRNAGKLPHSFKIGSRKTPVLAPGKTAKLTVTFAKTGMSAYLSTVAGDSGKGLKGVLTIKAAPLPPGVVGDPVAGKQLFLSSSCGACHTLKAAGTKGGAGPNLDQTPSLYATIVNQITRGGEGMTAYSSVLSKAQIQDVAAFVYVSTHP